MSPTEAVTKHRELVATWRSGGPDAALEQLHGMQLDDVVYLLMMHTGVAAATGSAMR